MRIYPEGHAVCVIPSLVFTLRLDENFYAGIGAIGHAQLKFDLMGWSVTGEFRQAANVEYDEYTMQQLQMYMMHLASLAQDGGQRLTRDQEQVVRHFSSACEEAAAASP